MNLYKQHGINPLGGCLPMLIQMPIYIALYSMLGNSVELYRSGFVGWIHDRFGAGAVRDWYGGRPLPEATGMAWAELEQKWRDDLDQILLGSHHFANVLVHARHFIRTGGKDIHAFLL